MNRTKSQQKFLDGLAQALYGSQQNELACVRCHTPVNDASFKDDVSRREFKLSGFCQSCQDFIFVEE